MSPIELLASELISVSEIERIINFWILVDVSFELLNNIFNLIDDSLLFLWKNI